MPTIFIISFIFLFISQTISEIQIDDTRDSLGIQSHTKEDGKMSAEVRHISDAIISKWGIDKGSNATIKEFNLTSQDSHHKYDIQIVINTKPIERRVTPKDVREHAFITWINFEVQKEQTNLTVIKTIDELKNGRHILYLLYSILKKSSYINPVEIYNDTERNFEEIIKLFDTQNMTTKIFTKNTDKIEEDILTILCLIRDYKILWTSKSITENLLNPDLSKSPEMILLEWCSKSVSNYNISVTNFNTSWSNGLALGAIMARWDGSVNYNIISLLSTEQRLSLLLEYAYKFHDVPMLLRPQDLINNIFDERTILLYVTYLYQGLPHSLNDLSQIFDINPKIEEIQKNILKKIDEFNSWSKKINAQISIKHSITSILDIKNLLSTFSILHTDVESYKTELNAEIMKYENYFARNHVDVPSSIKSLCSEWSVTFVNFQNTFNYNFSLIKTKLYEELVKFVERQYETILKNSTIVDNNYEHVEIRYEIYEKIIEQQIESYNGVLSTLKRNEINEIEYILDNQDVFELNQLQHLKKLVTSVLSVYDRIQNAVNSLSSELNQWINLKTKLEKIEISMHNATEFESAKHMYKENQRMLNEILTDGLALQNSSHSKVAKEAYNLFIKRVQKTLQDIVHQTEELDRNYTFSLKLFEQVNVTLSILKMHLGNWDDSPLNVTEIKRQIAIIDEKFAKVRQPFQTVVPVNLYNELHSAWNQFIKKYNELEPPQIIYFDKNIFQSGNFSAIVTKGNVKRITITKNGTDIATVSCTYDVKKDCHLFYPQLFVNNTEYIGTYDIFLETNYRRYLTHILASKRISYSEAFQNRVRCNNEEKCLYLQTNKTNGTIIATMKKHEIGGPVRMDKTDFKETLNATFHHLKPKFLKVSRLIPVFP